MLILTQHNGIRTKIYFTPSPPRERGQKHIPTYGSQCRVYFVSCRKPQLTLVWSKLSNFSRKPTDLVQHPNWIKPEITWSLSKVCSYELTYVQLITCTEVSSRSIVGTKPAKLQHVLCHSYIAGSEHLGDSYNIWGWKSIPIDIFPGLKKGAIQDVRLYLPPYRNLTPAPNHAWKICALQSIP